MIPAKYEKTFVSVCPVCGRQETNPNIMFCIDCSGRMRLHDGANTCINCGKTHDQKVVYLERSFMLCPDCLVPLTKTTRRVL